MPNCHPLILFFSKTVQKGVSANMLKIGSKRRRTKAQVKADKLEAELKEQDIQTKLARLAAAEEKLL